MCCHAKLDLTQAFLKKNRGRKTIDVYKLVKKSKFDVYDYNTGRLKFVRNRLTGIYRCSFEYNHGVIKSKTNRKLITRNNDIKHGIHVWLSLSSVRSHQRRKAGAGYKIIKLTVNINDLIGVGTFDSEVNKDNAVFRKVNLSKSEYNRVLGVKEKK